MEALYLHILHKTILAPLFHAAVEVLSALHKALYLLHKLLLGPLLHTLAQPLAHLELRALRLLGLNPDTTQFRAFPLATLEWHPRGCSCCGSYAGSLYCLGLMVAVRLGQDRARDPYADISRTIDALMLAVSNGPNWWVAALAMVLRQYVVLAVVNPALVQAGEDGDLHILIHEVAFLALAVV